MNFVVGGRNGKLITGGMAIRNALMYICCVIYRRYRYSLIILISMYCRSHMGHDIVTGMVSESGKKILQVDSAIVTFRKRLRMQRKSSSSDQRKQHRQQSGSRRPEKNRIF